MTFNELIQLTIGLNDIVVQEVSAVNADRIAVFVEKVQELVDEFENSRIQLVTVSDEDERDEKFHALLQKNVELPDIKFSVFKDVKFKTTTVILLKRLNLW